MLCEEQFADLRGHVPTAIGALYPGDEVYMAGVRTSYGILVSLKGPIALVMWAQQPTINQRRVARNVRELRDEIDADIMHELLAASSK